MRAFGCYSRRGPAEEDDWLRVPGYRSTDTMGSPDIRSNSDTDSEGQPTPELLGHNPTPESQDGPAPKAPAPPTAHRPSPSVARSGGGTPISHRMSFARKSARDAYVAPPAELGA